MSVEGETTWEGENGRPINMVQPWEARERERDLYPCPISVVTWALLRNVGLLNYYEQATSLKAPFVFLAHLILWWSVQEKGFHFDLEAWYRNSKEDIYFITAISKREEDFPQFPYVPHGVAIESQLAYSQRYVGPHAVYPTDFQVCCG